MANVDSEADLAAASCKTWGAPEVYDVVAEGGRSLGFRLANTPIVRSAAVDLVNTMYSRRGYGANHRLPDTSSTVTFTSHSDGDVVGTITLTIDSESGLLVDEAFGDIVDKYRAMGAVVCEVTKFAFIPEKTTKKSLAALFNLLYLHAHNVSRCTDIFIEVNPRHQRYYMSMLGFGSLCEDRTNVRVNAPACLLHLSMADMRRFIDTHAGKGTEVRSLYPHFFTRQEEKQILSKNSWGVGR